VALGNNGFQYPNDRRIMPQFEARVTLPCSQREAFDFLLRPADVALISPPQLGLHFVDAPEVVSQGDKLKFRVQGFGQIREGEHEITRVVEHSQVTERQLVGLFKLWVHEHLFETNSHGEAVIIDQIDFEAPGGILGLLVTKDRVLDQLEEAFDHRHARLQKLLKKKV